MFLFISIIFNDKNNFVEAVDYEDSITYNFVCSPYTSGNPTCGTEVVVESYQGFSAFLRQEQSVAYNPSTQETLIVYTKIIDPNNLSSRSIRAAVVGSNGALIRQPFDLISNSNYNKTKSVPRAIYNGNGFVVAFEYGDFLSSDILLVVLSSTYSILGVITAIDHSGSQSSPSIYYNSNSQQYALAYLSAPMISPIYVGVTFFTLTGTTTYTEIRSTMIDVSLSSSASPTNSSSNMNAGLPVIQPTSTNGNYLVASECQTTTRTTIVLYNVVVADGSWTLRDTISLSTSENSSLPIQTSPKFVYSAIQNRYLIAMEATIFPGITALERLQVFAGFVSSSGIFTSLNDTFRPFSDQQGAVVSQPWVAISSTQTRFLIACKSTLQGKTSAGIGFGSVANASNTDVFSSANFNSQSGSSSFPIATSFPSTSDPERMIVVWRELRVQPVTIIPESVVQSSVDNSGAIAAAVVVPIVTICILVAVGIALWYRFWKVRFQFKPVSRGDIISLPPPPTDEELMYDRDGKPMYAEDGRPLYDQQGNPLYDAQGNPLYSEDGDPLYDQDGNPLYDSEGNPIYLEGENAEKSMVRLRDGTVMSRNAHLKTIHSKAELPTQRDSTNPSKT